MENDEKVKGRVCNEGLDVKEEEENRKMEEFFALIRGFQEARNRRKVEILEERERKKAKKTIRVDRGQSSSWVPSFVWEDFTAEIEFGKPPLIFPQPCNRKNDEEDGNGINLKLAL
ncbi:hypothetical protein K2173_014497 [Erythroxylum novogranatense]|uniref:Protein NIM1-INTERACTING 1-like n=1 Tax=Erythroxylum novogranatense TaxID=1862640 RepID=A0AAV8S530_9ROSI|nr:hypothetical protein K2173_014497 [Erythroxylum novogranatense]